MKKLETLDAEINAIFAKHEHAPKEREAVVKLHRVLLGALKRPATACKIKEFISEHRGNSALHADMLQTAQLFMGAVGECLRPQETQA